MKFASLALLLAVTLIHPASFAATHPLSTHQQVPALQLDLSASFQKVAPLLQVAMGEDIECGDSDNDGVCDTQGSED